MSLGSANSRDAVNRAYLEGPPETYRLTSAATALIVVFGASMLLINLGSVRALTFHEVIFAEPAREMLRDGHWIVPTIAGVPMLDKTPATAWTIAASMWLFGSEAEWAARLPAVVASILTALCVASMTARWFGARAGLLAGLMELTTFHVLAMGRLAEADMPLCLAVAVAMYAFAAAHVDGPRGLARSRWLPWLFHAAVAVSFMIKWLLGPMLIGGACLAYLVVSREWRVLRFLFNPIGLLLQLAVIAPWVVAAYRIYPGIVDQFILHHFGRARGAMGSLEPWYAYLYLIPFLALPWVPYALLAAIERRRNGRSFEPFWKFASCWIVPGLLLLSANAFRSRNYAIPLVPPLVMLAAVGFHEYLKRRATTANSWQPWLAGLTAVSGIAGVAIVLVKQPSDAMAIAAIIALAAGGCVLSLECERRRRATWQIAGLMGTVWIVSVGVQSWIMPSHDSFRPLADLGRRVASHAAGGETIHLVELPEVQIPFYIDRPMQGWHQYQTFIEAKASASVNAVSCEPLLVVTSQDYLNKLSDYGAIDVLDQADRKSRRPQDRDRLALVRFTPATAADVAGSKANPRR